MDIYAVITDRMIQEMEQGQIPWRKPWMAAGSAISHTTGKPYSLLNQMLLGKAGEWLTFKQCQEEGGRIHKGEKSRFVVFWKFVTMKDEETDEEKQIPFLKYYNVFHISQCENIKARYVQTNPNPAKADEAAEAIITEYVKREGVTLEHCEGDAAFYQPAADRIVLPMMKQFVETAEYYGTAFHEMVHSTGHMKRLARLDSTANFGSEEYSKEELTAEIGSAALVHHVGLETSKSFRNSAAYIQNWLQVLKDDKRFIISAASKADKAVNYILTGQ
ncbi:MAG: zincin-like metallopeptidase domain-containing protein [Eubacteriales bacterium]|nr:zincin-like metallopeptidase domain-containing protein [Eubacteriales bacterium]